MKRSKPMRRKTPMKRGRSRRETRPGPGRDEAYLAWVRGLPCYLHPDGTCMGVVHAHHAGPKRMDRTAIPLCAKHHGEWHDMNGNGYFGDYDKDRRRRFADLAIGQVQLFHDGIGEDDLPACPF